MLPAALLALVPVLGLAVAGWVASLRLRDASIADRLWALLVAAPAAVYAWHFPPAADALSRSPWVLALLLAWAARLALHITWRNWGHGEDRRYAAMRAQHGPRFPLRSLFTVFLLQALLAWIVSWPLLAALAGTRPFGPWDAIGLALAAFGIVFEAVADAQLARFRANPASRNRVLQHGLWRFSRHPNYFGEACVWWGFGLVVLGSAGWPGAWALASPLLMTVLLLRVSGVRLLEADIADRRPAYRDYIRRTSAFLPLPPRPLP